MGRIRKLDKHLPRRVYLVHGSYYFRPKGAKPINLGKDLAAALAKYGTLIAGNWSGRTLGDIIDRYRTEVLSLKRSADTRADQAKQLDRLKVAFGAMLPDNVTAQHCYAYQDGLALGRWQESTHGPRVTGGAALAPHILKGDSMGKGLDKSCGPSGSWAASRETCTGDARSG